MFDFLGRPKSLSLLAAASAAAIVAAISPAMAQEQQRQFDIPAQPLRTALIEFARQADILVVTDTDTVEGLHAPAVVGSFTPSEALSRLIAGSGLRANARAAGGFVLTDAASPTQLGDASAAAPSEDEEIVVTGTRVRGAPSASPMQEITRDDIETSGYTTTSELVQSVPQNYNGGAQGVVGTQGPFSANEFSSYLGSTTPSLRGLGDATLTLVNGHRIASTGAANGADISSIPLGAIDRVEIVADGASSIYGADAVAGVINVLLRDDYSGVQTSFSASEPTRNGGGGTQVGSVLGGADWATGNVLASYTYTRQFALDAEDRDFSSNAALPTSLTPDLTSQSVTLFVNQALTSRLSFYADGFYTERTGERHLSAPGFGQFQDLDGAQYSLAGGLRRDGGAGWDFAIEALLASDESEQALYFIEPPIGLDSISTSRGRMHSIEVSGNGPIFAVNSNEVELALGAGLRNETYRLDLSSQPTASLNGERDVGYIFAELNAPIVVPGQGGAGLYALNINVSGRLDDYSDIGDTFNPKLGIVYRPFEDLAVSASVARSFRPPVFTQQLQSSFGLLFTGADPSFPGGAGPVLYISGGNPDLRPETADTWTVTLRYTPSLAPGLAFSATYFNYDFQDKIINPISAGFLAPLRDPIVEPFVVFAPTTAELNALVLPTFINIADPPATLLDTLAIMDNRAVNAARWRARGVDLSADYAWSVGGNDFALSANATFLELTQRATPAAAEVELTGIVFNPPDFRMRAGVTWSNGAWSAASFVNVTGSEENTFVSPASELDAFTTVDAQVSYLFGERDDGTRIALSVSNLFDEDPPFLDAGSTTFPGLGYDAANASPLGRVIALSVTHDW